MDHALEHDMSLKDARVECDVQAVQEAIDSLLTTGEASTHTLKALVRSVFLGPLTVCDYSSVEARVLAWLADEQWALEAFAAGKDIYSETAAKMTAAGGRKFSRQEGKSATLGLGFAGSTRALRNVGMTGTDEELQPIVTTWRQANKRIVRFWERLWDAWVNGGTAGKIKITRSGRARQMHLPSGGSIWYQNVKYDHYFIEEDGKRKRQEGWRYDHPSGGRVRVWSGIAVENITQRVARDLLANALIELDREGLPVIAHVHDEVLVEGVHPVERISEVMCRKPAWAEGLPVDADGFHAPTRYRKG